MWFFFHHKWRTIFYLLLLLSLTSSKEWLSERLSVTVICLGKFINSIKRCLCWLSLISVVSNSTRWANRSNANILDSRLRLLRLGLLVISVISRSCWLWTQKGMNVKLNVAFTSIFKESTVEYLSYLRNFSRWMHYWYLLDDSLDWAICWLLVILNIGLSLIWYILLRSLFTWAST